MTSFAYVYGHFLTRDIFEPINAALVEAEGKDERKVGLQIEAPFMPNDDDCGVRMRFVVLDEQRQNIIAGQAFLDDVAGKWLIFDFSDDDGSFLIAMEDVLHSLGDVLIANRKEGS